MTENGHSSLAGCANVEDDGEMSAYKKDALSVVTFKIVYNEEDFKTKNFLEFKPEMAHQVFGESENIFGYRSLSVSLYYLHNSSNCYADIHCADKIKSDLYKPDDVLGCLNQWLPENFTTDGDKFKKMMENEDHDIMFGKVLTTFKDTKTCALFPHENVFATYKITECDLKDEKFKEYHQRFETFIVWFIDAANFIDLEDEKWMIFYVYEELEHPVTKKLCITPIGFCTIYNFFCYPDKMRSRISQFFVLPSHQRRGIGARLYHTIAQRLRELPSVVDITVEEPTAVFQKVRDIDDSHLILEKLKEHNKRISTMSRDNAVKFMHEYKICQRQSRRLVDVLNCYSVLKNKDEYQKYLDSIKNRIKTYIEKDNCDNKKRKFDVAMTNVEPVDKKAAIEAEFKKYVSEIEPSVKGLEQLLQNKI
nr:unnamed protein product [Callosobruchus chinensis]